MTRYKLYTLPLKISLSCLVLIYIQLYQTAQNNAHAHQRYPVKMNDKRGEKEFTHTNCLQRTFL
uniref:Uncharacterized protein n=1 Tax=Anguilla anguilla TaxID=7936 RepID=A0A0E9T6K5_ANGAN